MPQVTIQNIELHYHEQGDAQQPTVLLIHGLGCSIKYWNGLFQAQEFAHYHTVALDLPGFGGSEKPDTYNYSLPSQAEIVFAFMQALQLRNVSLIGHSMGGAVAILLAHNHHELVKQLLVVEPNLRANDAQLSRHIIQQQEVDFVRHYDAFRDSAIATVEGWFVNYHQTDLESYISELLKTTPISMYRSALSLIEVTSDENLLLQFQKLPMPKYLLVGEETMKLRQLPKQLQDGGIQVVVIPGVGHMMMVDNPALFHKTLASILP